MCIFLAEGTVKNTNVIIYVLLVTVIYPWLFLA